MKAKRVLAIGIRERLLQAQSFDHTVFTYPRNFTRHMTAVVRYPQRINDIGRTVDVRRETEQTFIFELRQKRYLGRGTFAVSAQARGVISYIEGEEKTRISGYIHLGGQYVALLSFMTSVVLLSNLLTLVTVLYLPLALLMLAVLGLHWIYLFADRQDLKEQLHELVELTDRELRLSQQETAIQTIAAASDDLYMATSSD